VFDFTIDGGTFAYAHANGFIHYVTLSTNGRQVATFMLI